MGGKGQGKLLGSDLEFVEVGEDNLRRRGGDAGVEKDDVVAQEEVLKEVASAEQRLNLVNAEVELHCFLRREKCSADLYTTGGRAVK
jgi:hypothetical protein